MVEGLFNNSTEIIRRHTRDSTKVVVVITNSDSLIGVGRADNSGLFRDNEDRLRKPCVWTDNWHNQKIMRKVHGEGEGKRR